MTLSLLSQLTITFEFKCIKLGEDQHNRYLKKWQYQKLYKNRKTKNLCQFQDWKMPVQPQRLDVDHPLGHSTCWHIKWIMSTCWKTNTIPDNMKLVPQVNKPFSFLDELLHYLQFTFWSCFNPPGIMKDKATASKSELIFNVVFSALMNHQKLW